MIFVFMIFSAANESDTLLDEFKLYLDLGFHLLLLDVLMLLC